LRRPRLYQGSSAIEEEEKDVEEEEEEGNEKGADGVEGPHMTRGV
jgi:hypothetical protein